MSKLKQFSSVTALINAKARRTHKANLNYGGVFNSKNKRISNLKNEKIYAKRFLIHANSYNAKEITGKPYNSKKSVVYIPNLGWSYK